MSAKSTPTWLPRVIFESALITVSILLALGLDEWRENRESEETIRDTKEWLLQVQPDDFDVTIITTYPGTPYFDRAVRDPSREDVWVYTFEKTGDRLYAAVQRYRPTSGA